MPEEVCGFFSRRLSTPLGRIPRRLACRFCTFLGSSRAIRTWSGCLPRVGVSAVIVRFLVLLGPLTDHGCVDSVREITESAENTEISPIYWVDSEVPRF